MDCIPTHLTKLLSEAIKNGELSIQGLYDAKSSAEREAMVGKYVNEETSKFFTRGFEKAIASDSEAALDNWYDEIATPKEKKAKPTFLDKVAKLKDKGFVTPGTTKATLTNLISEMLGLKVDANQMRVISETADVIRANKKLLVFAERRAASPDVSFSDAIKMTTVPRIEYSKSVEAMQDYINSQSPQSGLKTITGGILRAFMLTSPATPVLNFVSNTVQGVMQSIEQRASTGQITGSSAENIGAYVSHVMQIYEKSGGRDISRNYDAHKKLGENVLHSEGPGWLRGVNRFMAKWVYHYALGAADAAFAAARRADSAQLQAAKIARKMGLTGKEAEAKALEILKDSMRLEPKTPDGLIVAAQSVADAESATWTNKTWASEVSLTFRDWLNKATGDFQLGYWTNPFVKTGANVLQFGIDNSIFGFAQPLYGLPSAWRTLNDKTSLELEKKATPAERAKMKRERWQPMGEVIRLAVRAGMGTTLAMILTALIPPDDFIGAYEQISQKQRDMMGLKKGVYNAVKIGGHWISLDYFGALGAGFVGMMYARKYGKGGLAVLYDPETQWAYARGAGGQLLQVPGLQDFSDLWESLTNVLKKDTTWKEGLGGITTETYNTLSGRVIPGIVFSIAKATDTKERAIDKGKFFDQTKARIPGRFFGLGRKSLQPKIDQTTGQEVESEGFWSTMLFGSRAKTANESALIDEISRLDKLGYAPAISDIERSSKRVQDLHKQIGDARYQTALKRYGMEYGRRASKLIKTNAYRKAEVVDKQKKLNKVRDEERDDMLKKFHYRKPKNKGLKVK